MTALQVAPSPSRGGVAVSFTSPVQTVARVEIFDVSGRLIQRLPDTMVLRGVNTLRWDGKGGSGKSVASGVYFARIWVGGSERLERFVIAR